MREGIPTTKAELLADIDRRWTALNATLQRLTDAQMTGIRDPQGWAVKDHLIHLTSWERSIVFFLHGQPRHEGLRVEESLYSEGTDDEINAVIQQQLKDLPLADAFAQSRDTHGQLLALLGLLTDDDLKQPYRHFLPDEPGADERPRAFDLVYSNSARHYRDHLGWIEALVASAH